MKPDEITPPQFRNSMKKDDSSESAANVIRTKLNALYGHEPDAVEEVHEVETIKPSKMSKHQKYMADLVASGKDTAEIQTAWHEYYTNLPENQKHEVWQEFYSQKAQEKEQKKAEAEQKKLEEQQRKAKEHADAQELERLRANNTGRARRNSKNRPKTNSKISKVKQNHHFRSLVFGLSMGFTMLFILMFSFFNERFLVPFIRPSANVSATPIIVDPNLNQKAGPESKIIIPKINLEAPVIYDVKTVAEDDIQNGLESGVVHYPTTPNPGETGNAVIFGHSSGNILNKGKYKFAFLLLKSLEKGDTFIVQKDRKKYVYKVYEEFVTTPTDFSVLNPTDRPATMTLITCDPPGTSTNRLIIRAEQIFPNPATNKKSSVKPNDILEPAQLPSNSKTLWQRLVNLF